MMYVIIELINKAGNVRRKQKEEEREEWGETIMEHNNLLLVEGGYMQREVAYKFLGESGCHYGGCWASWY